MKRYLTANALGLAVIAGMLVGSAYFASSLPEQLAVHWDIHGDANAFGPRWIALWSLPAAAVLIVSLLPLLLRISPNGFQMANSTGTVARVSLTAVVLLACLHSGMLLTGSDPGHYRMAPFLAAGIGVFMVSFGNVLSKSERNFFLGIRTPWTLVSDDNWQATHRLAAKLLVVGGIIVLAASPFVAIKVELAIAALVSALLVPVAYSYWFHAQDRDTPTA